MSNQPNPSQANRIYLPIIGILVLIIFFLRECGNKCQEPIITSDTVTVVEYDTISFIEVRKEYYPVIKDVRLPALPIDTQALVADYYAVKFDTDTFFNDSDYRVMITDTLYMNKRLSRRFEHVNLRPTNITTVINTTKYDSCPDLRFKVFVGGFVGGNLDKFSAGPEIVFLTKKDHMYNVKYDAIAKTYMAGTAFKIRLKKK